MLWHSINHHITLSMIMTRARTLNQNFLLTMVVVVTFCLLSISMFSSELQEVTGWITALDGTTMAVEDEETASSSTTTTSTTPEGWMQQIAHLTSTSNPPPLDGGRHNYIACHNDSMDDTVPAFVIAGVQKGGTSALNSILKQHPNLLSSKKFEPHFFDFGHALMTDLKQAAVNFHSQTIQQANQRQTQNTTNLKGRLQNVQTQDVFDPTVICNIRQAYLSKHFLLSTNKRREYSLSGGPVLAEFEKTPAYICKPEVPILMQLIIPWTKIIVILRNPVDRAYSSFKMCREIFPGTCNPSFEVNVEQDILQLKKRRPEHMQQIPSLAEYRLQPQAYHHLFHTNHSSGDDNHNNNNNNNQQTQHNPYEMPSNGNSVGIIRRGLYAEQLIPWLRHYTLNVNLKVISYEYLNQSKQKAIDEILDFLQIPKYNYTNEELEKHYPNPFEKAKNPRRYTRPMDPITKDYLERFYAPHNQQLQSLLGPEWKGIWEP